MARTRKHVNIDEEIEKTEMLVLKRKEMYDKAVEALKDLREKKEQANQEALLAAVANSKHSYEDIMAYIQSDPEDTDFE